jgi:hypothetical protein
MAETSIYSALREDRIRLLKFTSNSNGKVVCSMREIRLDEATGTFYALSYVWGDNTSTKAIICNGQTMHIRATLYEAIENMFMPPISLDGPIWIDAICINQDDTVEKSVHVAKMGDVYRMAREVVVWLGPAGPGNDLAMDSMKLLSTILPALRVRPVYDDLPKFGLPDKENALWPALSYLFRRKWYERLWTFQEAVLSSSLLFVCGYRASRLLINIGSDLWRLGLLHLCVAKGYDVPEDGFLALEDIRSAREDMAQFRGLNFTYLLSVANSKHCSDPRDRYVKVRVRFSLRCFVFNFADSYLGVVIICVSRPYSNSAITESTPCSACLSQALAPVSPSLIPLNHFQKPAIKLTSTAQKHA